MLKLTIARKLSGRITIARCPTSASSRDQPQRLRGSAERPAALPDRLRYVVAVLACIGARAFRRSRVYPEQLPGTPLALPRARGGARRVRLRRAGRTMMNMHYATANTRTSPPACFSLET